MTGKKNKVSIFHFCFANLKKRRLLDGNRLHFTPIYKVPFHMKTPPSRVVVPHSSHQQHRVGIFHPGLRCGSAISPPHTAQAGAYHLIMLKKKNHIIYKK